MVTHPRNELGSTAWQAAIIYSGIKNKKNLE